RRTFAPLGSLSLPDPQPQNQRSGAKTKGRTMNSLTHSKTPSILPLLIAAVLACFGLLPKTEAVVPPPDGGYPGGNTAEGQAALLSLTTGGFNTAAGWLSLRSITTG